VQVGVVQVGHHHPVRPVVADIGAVNPNMFAAIQFHIQRFDFAIREAGNVAHRADTVTIQDLHPLAQKVSRVLINRPGRAACRPGAAMIGGAFRGITGAQVFIALTLIGIGLRFGLVILLWLPILLQLVLILLLLLLILGVCRAGLGLGRDIGVVLRLAVEPCSDGVE
jgi:hypothetical protein